MREKGLNSKEKRSNIFTEIKIVVKKREKKVTRN